MAEEAQSGTTAKRDNLPAGDDTLKAAPAANRAAPAKPAAKQAAPAKGPTPAERRAAGERAAEREERRIADLRRQASESNFAKSQFEP